MPVEALSRAAGCGCGEGYPCTLCRCQSGRERRVPCGHGGDPCAAHGPGQERPATRRSHASAQTSYRLHPSAVTLLVVCSLVTAARAAPTPRQSHWNNPCALDPTASPPAGTGSSDAQLIDRVMHLNRVVRPQVDKLMAQFIESTYHADEAEMLRDWGHHNISWLGFVRDSIEVQRARLGAADSSKALSLSDALRMHFSDLQRLAVGFEQITVEAALYGDLNLDAFRRLQADLMQLLCELHIAILEKQLEPDVVTADVMDADSRQLGTRRERNLRNWVIIREYKRYIAHLDDIFQALRKRYAAD